jgi:hypothetical protein
MLAISMLKEGGFNASINSFTAHENNSVPPVKKYRADG